MDLSQMFQTVTNSPFVQSLVNSSLIFAILALIAKPLIQKWMDKDYDSGHGRLGLMPHSPEDNSDHEPRPY